jgi:hypothetical protein
MDIVAQEQYLLPVSSVFPCFIILQLLHPLLSPRADMFITLTKQNVITSYQGILYVLSFGWSLMKETKYLC